MLELKKIKKDYPAGGGVVHALRGIDLVFRKSEFVSILGPSGCGKTTLLNIIGGLDGYTEGDLIINGTSTKNYKDRDWDTYRNHSVGFVFQSYNLIPHQSVLQNVELALTLSGVSRGERRKRAKSALEAVGLGDQLSKRPGEMSGGQMQRVAIARALVNNPDIILADEPTGALDTETSVQVMEILKEVSKERLVIMVTHNPELAEKYSSRIIRMVDGNLIHDSAPLNDAEKIELAEQNRAHMGQKKQKKPTMSFGTSFMLSLKNLFTKKGRTILTSFAGSIGIIGIALILSISEGMTAYINAVQESTLSAYPLTLESTTIDMSSLIESFMNAGEGGEHDKDAIYKDPVIGELVNALSELEANENDLGAFKSYLESELKKKDSPVKAALSGIQYSYAMSPVIYTKNTDGTIIKSDTNELMMEMMGDFILQVMTGGDDKESSSTDQMGGGMSGEMMTSMAMGRRMWQELLPGLADENGQRPVINQLLHDQYDVIHGRWPEAKDEIILVINENNELDDLTLYALGLLSESEIDAIIDAAASGQPLPESDKKWSYEEICELTFRAVFPYDKYEKIGDTFKDVSGEEFALAGLYNEAMELRVVGIIRPSEDADTTMLSGSVGYTYMLTEHIIKEAESSAVVEAQLASPDTDVLTGLPFESNTGVLSDKDKKEAFAAYVDGLDEKGRAEVYVSITALEAVKAGLSAQVEAALNGITDKDQIINMIVSMAGSSSGISADRLSEMFADKTIDELKEMLRPSIESMISERITEGVKGQMAAMPDAQKAAALGYAIGSYTDEQMAFYYDEITRFSSMTYEQVLTTIGCLDLDKPAMINLFASSFENKDVIVDAIAAYNDSVDEARKIAYTDYLGIMMSSITTIINAITYVLIAFVAISLVVSSIMIGVITLISVQERTKEIGILRAIGASKKDVSGMFNAETVIIGFTSGLLGVVVTYLLCIPINIILHSLTGIANLKAIFPLPAALILIGISVLLTLISGIIPSRSAAKKDPVVALRTE